MSKLNIILIAYIAIATFTWGHAVERSSWERFTDKTGMTDPMCYIGSALFWPLYWSDVLWRSK